MSKTYIRRHTKLDNAAVLESMRPGQTYTTKQLAEMHAISQASMQIVVGAIEVSGKIEPCGSQDGNKLFRLAVDQPKFVTARPLNMQKMYFEITDKVKRESEAYRSFMPVIEVKK